MRLYDLGCEALSDRGGVPAPVGLVGLTVFDWRVGGRMTKFVVRRLDTNPENVYTFDTWVRVSDFKTRKLAEDYVKRAAGPKQRLRVTEESGV